MLTDVELGTTCCSVSGQGFVDWLRESIRTRKMMINEPGASVHMVAGRVFLVSPGIFKPYIPSTTGETGEQWKSVQRAFQRLSLHYYENDATNIFTCEVKGPRKTRRVKGYLLDKLEFILEALHRKIICICLYLFEPGCMLQIICLNFLDCVLFLNYVVLNINVIA